MKIRLPRISRFSGPDNSAHSQENIKFHVSSLSSLRSSSDSKDSHSKETKERLIISSFCRKSFVFFQSSFNLKMKKDIVECKKSISNKIIQEQQSTLDSCNEDDQRNQVDTTQETYTGGAKDIISLMSEQEYQILLSRMNLLELMQEEELPKDLLPGILAFAGPQAAKSLSLTSKLWRKIVLEESVWRVLCEEMSKWVRGDSIPESWLNYYCKNPCIPVDYRSIESVMDSINNPRLNKSSEDHRKFHVQETNIRILLYPGIYVLLNPITINSLNGSTITIETIQKPYQQCINSCQDELSTDETSIVPSSQNSTCGLRKYGSMKFLRNICRKNRERSRIPAELENSDLLDFSGLLPSICQSSHATLVMDTDRRNVPVIRVTQGKLHLKKINMIHNCEGTDIWNGNAALQIQPPLDSSGRSFRNISPLMRPIGILNEVAISSLSGRGMVSIDGGRLVSNNCYVSNCAATGIYVGGPGSSALVEKTDVLHNGHGNKRRRHGVARGHSGVYLEQGTAILRDCNISSNSLTGISAVSHQNAFLTVEDTDITGNGSIQLEMPPIGSHSWEKSVSTQNRISQIGSGKNRSGLNQEEESSLSAAENFREISQEIIVVNTPLTPDENTQNLPHVIPL